MQAQPNTPLGKRIRGETCHGGYLNTVDTTDRTSDAAGYRRNRTLPWAGVLAGENARRVFLMLWILLAVLEVLVDAGTTGHSPGQAFSRGNMPWASFCCSGYY